jgi:hypothetical protein
MDLISAVKSLDGLDPEATIYAAEPWSSSSPILIVSNAPDATDQSDGVLTYFLEVSSLESSSKISASATCKRPVIG